MMILESDCMDRSDLWQYECNCRAWFHSSDVLVEFYLLEHLVGLLYVYHQFVYEGWSRVDPVLSSR